MIPKFRFWYEREDFYPDENYMRDVWGIEYITDNKIELNDDYIFNPYTNVAENIYAKTKIYLMKYTGLKDQNGVEIYEGDIVVAWSNGLEGTFVIKWRQEGSPSWILYPAWQNSEFWNLHGSLHNDGQYYDKGIEVIGNIYENPELLEVSN